MSTVIPFHRTTQQSSSAAHAETTFEMSSNEQSWMY